MGHKLIAITNELYKRLERLARCDGKTLPGIIDDIEQSLASIDAFCHAENLGNSNSGGMGWVSKTSAQVTTGLKELFSHPGVTMTVTPEWLRIESHRIVDALRGIVLRRTQCLNMVCSMPRDAGSRWNEN